MHPSCEASQAILVPDASISLPLSSAVKSAPYNASAALSVEFSVTADKEALPNVIAYCTFLGRVYDAGSLSSWSLNDVKGSSRGCPASTPLCGRRAAEADNQTIPDKDQQLVSADTELPLAPFILPATSVEQFVRDCLSFTVVRTADSEGARSKEALAKAPGTRSEGKEKGGRSMVGLRSAIPHGETRMVEMPVAELLLLNEGECVHLPEGMHDILSSLKGIASFRIRVRARNSLLSRELRHLLNPVWLHIKGVRALPPIGPPVSQIQCTHRTSGETKAATPAPLKKRALGAAARSAAADSNLPAPPALAEESKCLFEEPFERRTSVTEGQSKAGAASEGGGPLRYFARARCFSRNLETEPTAPTGPPDALHVRWNRGFLCFWGPAALSQKELRDFLEEQRLEVRLCCSEENAGLTNTTESQFGEKAASGKTQGKQPHRPGTAAEPSASAKMATVKHVRDGGNSAATAVLLDAPAQSLASSTPSDNNGNTMLPECPTSPRSLPYGRAAFCLSALAACGATRLSLSARVLPVLADCTLGGSKSGDSPLAGLRASALDFVTYETRMTLRLRLAEPLFQFVPFILSPRAIQDASRTQARPLQWRGSLRARRLLRMHQTVPTAHS
ncbi:uncharacterized protein LOC34620259 [Cyclospora cayetanensis]|uniref:Uncharacterized protein LOC34620259 n=1 Tax=Cyclospora cayetanensis TaxID=88456 RepID=A0A6P6RU58_9EIME|nr:uncharacterized protein LOC34620259 [Cyclospora cayetanensis]